MSLKTAYSLAHSAECRLQIAASRPDRDLRFVVGHLMHYESLRLRIVEIEHAESTSSSGNLKFRGAGDPSDRLLKKPSTGDLKRRSPPPPTRPEPEESDDEEDSSGYGDLSGDEDDDDDDDDDDAGLGLTRFASGAARPPTDATRPPPLEHSDGDDDDDDDEDSDSDDEPVSPEDPDQETLAQLVKGDGSALLESMYKGVKNCPCHGLHKEAPEFGRMWELPAKEGDGGARRAVAEVRVAA